MSCGLSELGGGGGKWGEKKKAFWYFDFDLVVMLKQSMLFCPK